MKELKIKHYNYFARLLLCFWLYLLISISLFLYSFLKLNEIVFASIIIPLMIILLAVLKFKSFARYYLYTFKTTKDCLYLKFYDKTSIKETCVKKEDLDIRIEKILSVGGHYKMTFMKNNKVVLIQHQIGSWNKENLLLLYSELNKLA